jgi:hypothetical protein
LLQSTNRQFRDGCHQDLESSTQDDNEEEIQVEPVQNDASEEHH